MSIGQYVSMSKLKPTAAGRALTDVILELFRLNNRLLSAGDRLVAKLGLTSARWQVLGTIIAAERAQPVSWLARDMGGNRQNVQRIVNDLAADGLVAFQTNPHHRRAQLVVLTGEGQRSVQLRHGPSDTLDQRPGRGSANGRYRGCARGDFDGPPEARGCRRHRGLVDATRCRGMVAPTLTPSIRSAMHAAALKAVLAVPMISVAMR